MAWRQVNEREYIGNLLEYFSGRLLVANRWRESSGLEGLSETQKVEFVKKLQAINNYYTYGIRVKHSPHDISPKAISEEKKLVMNVATLLLAGCSCSEIIDNSPIYIPGCQSYLIDIVKRIEDIIERRGVEGLVDERFH